MKIKHISILLLEDEINDVDLLKMELDKAPFSYQINHAKDKSSYQSFLKNEHHDIIISDQNLPQFSGLDALQIARQMHVDIPFILVSGFLGEDEAVKMVVEKGVNDFILKGKLGRLNHSILREIESHKVKSELEEKNTELRKLSLIARQTKNGVIITDAAGLVEWVNRSTVDLTGYSLKEFIGKKPSDLLHGPDTSLATKKRIRKKLEKRERVQEVILNYRKDGSKYWNRLDISPIYDEQNDFLKFVAIQEDVTEKIESEITLKERERLLASVTNNIPGVIIRYKLFADGSDEIDYVSDACSDILEITPQDIYADTSALWDLILPEYVDKMVSAIQKSADELSLWDFTYRIKTPSGKIKWINASGIPKRNGDEVSWYTLLLDITKEKQFELELVDINKELTRAQSIGSIGSWIFDIDSKKISWSDQIYHLYDRELNLGSPTFDEFLSYHDETEPDFQKLLNSIEEAIPYDVDVKLITKKGEIKFIRSVGIPERNSEGEVIRYTGVAQDITEKKLAELELKENQERITAITDNIDALLYRYVQFPDGSNKITYINKHVESIYELEQEQVINDAALVWDQIFDDDLEKLIYSVNKSYEELSTWRQEFRIITPSGKKKWLRGTGIPTKESDHVYWNTVITDITQEKEFEKTIQESNERYLEAQEIAQIGEWSVDLVSGDTYHSPIIKRIYEVEVEDEWQLEEGINFYKEGYSRNKIKQVLKEAIENGKPYEEDVIIVSAKGNERWVRAKCRPTFEDGKCVRLNGTLMDITKQKVLELQLIEQKERYQVAIQGADLGVWDSNIRDETNVANDRWYEMFGYKAEEIEESYSFFFSRVHPDDLDRITNEIEKIKKGEKDSFEEIVRVQHKNGNYITIVDKGTGLERDSEGKVTRIIGTHLDITKQKELQDQIKKSLDEKTVMLGEIHHRVKNNLAIISGLMELQEFGSDSEEVTEIVHDMTQRIRSIAGVHELLYENENFSNISFNKYVHILCKNVETSFINQTNIVFDISIDDSVLININQAVPIGLLMNELIINSFKHAFSEVDKPIIKFMMTFHDGKYHAEYYDNGPGVDMENLEDTNSLGTTLIYTLLDQLDADYKFGNKNGYSLIFDFLPQVSGSQANKYHN